MRRLKLFCSVLLLSVLSVGVTAVGVASAESTPLPDIHTALPGETYPINLGGKTASAGQVENAGGGQLEWTETSVLLSVLELTSLGLAIIVLLGLKSAIAPKHKCANEGGVEESGEVVLPER